MVGPVEGFAHRLNLPSKVGMALARGGHLRWRPLGSDLDGGWASSWLTTFCKIKEFKRIAMRACKTDRSFEAMIYLAAGVINSR